MNNHKWVFPVQFLIPVVLLAIVSFLAAVQLDDPFKKGLAGGLSISIIAYLIIAWFESMYRIDVVVLKLIAEKLANAEEFANQGLVRSLEKRETVKWEDFSSRAKTRYWVCGTSLTPLIQNRKEWLKKKIENGVDIRIILPRTSEGDNSMCQLEEFDQQEGLTIAQVQEARGAFQRFQQILPPERVKLYPGIMYESISIYDDLALLSFYNPTGIGDSNWTLQFEGSGSQGYIFAVKEFEYMWTQATAEESQQIHPKPDTH